MPKWATSVSVNHRNPGSIWRSARTPVDLCRPHRVRRRPGGPGHHALRPSGRYARRMLRSAILAAARSGRVERLVQTAPYTRDVVRRFVAGTTTADALRV